MKDEYCGILNAVIKCIIKLVLSVSKALLRLIGYIYI